MVVLGVLILLTFAVIVVATVARGDEPTTIDLEWFEIDSSVAGVFLAGALTLLLGVVGILVLVAGMRRSRRRRANIKELKARADAADRARADSSAKSHAEDREAETSTADSARERRETEAGQPPPPRDADESFDTAPRDRP